MIGEKYNRLTIISEPYKKGKYKVVDVECECGNKKVGIHLSAIKRNNTVSCGCKRKEGIYHTTHGQTGKRLYCIWANMIQRCTNQNNKSYKRYGARGITVCDEWLSFDNFKNWAISNGYNDNLKIDRIDNNDNYYPQNCRWATEKEQQRNKRSNHIIEYDNKKMCIAELSEHPDCKVSQIALKGRVNRGWNIMDAMTIPQEKSNYKRLLTYKNETKTMVEWSKDQKCKVNYSTLRDRIRKGWNVEEALTTLPLQ